MHKNFRWYLFGGILTALLIGFGLIVRNHNSPNRTVPLSSAVSTNQVTIRDYQYIPKTIKVKTGTKVTWTNQDQVHHSITADLSTKDAPNSPLIGQGQSYSFTFHKAGTYKFYCMLHPYMLGTVIVTN